MRCVQSFIFGLFLLQLARGEGNILGKTCPPPEAPENAEAIGNNTVGSVVKFLCKEGFYRLGNPHRIRCQSNGQWTKHNVSCVAVSCGDPGSPLNGKRKGWLFQYNNSVIFDCHRGFKLEGPNARTCLANQTWSGTQPICKPVPCEEPPKVPDAVMFGGGFVFGAHVYYTCNEGYKLKGPDTLTCGEDGKWVGETPVCKAVTCADPGTPQHGSTNSTGPPFSYLSMIFYKCNDGYILYGSDRRSCVGEGEWTGVQPFCVECAGVNTPVFVRNGQRFIHGIIQQKSKNIVTVLIDSSKEQRDVAIFGPGTQHYIIVEDKLPSPKNIFLGTRVIAMQRGTYIFAKVDAINGDKYSVTFEDKQRTKQTVALEHIRNLFPPTFCATCSDPGKPNKGFRTDNLEEFIVRTVVEFGCEINTRLIGSSKRTCQPSGRWSGEQPTCEITSCWDLDVFPPKNGKRIGDDFSIGSTVTFSCDEGYELDGESKLTCRPDGQWSDHTPLCKDRCEGVVCKLEEKCVYNSAQGVRCVCRDNVDCPADLQPICGSDAKTYNNYCIMKATACREGKKVEKVADKSCSPGGICQINPASKCRAYFRNFYFNVTTNTCQPIVAGGCHPSGWNGFPTMEDCNRTCSVDVCSQPTEPGPCSNTIHRWAFSPKAGRCKRFNYGGCFGNENNFDSKEKCNKRCPPVITEQGNKACPRCTQRKLREACKSSSIAFVGEVDRKLRHDPVKKQARYLVVIKNVLRKSEGFPTLGSVVVNVPYSESPDCPCPLLPDQETFLLMGDVVVEPKGNSAKVDISVTKPAVVQTWSQEFIQRMNRKCKDLDYRELL